MYVYIRKRLLHDHLGHLPGGRAPAPVAHVRRHHERRFLLLSLLLLVAL